MAKSCNENQIYNLLKSHNTDQYQVTISQAQVLSSSLEVMCFFKVDP